MTNSARFAAFGAQVLLVYPGPPADLDQRAKEFLAKQNELPLNLHLVIDPDYKFTNQYGLRWDAPKETAYPTTFLIDTSRRGVFSQDQPGSWRSNHCRRRAGGVRARKSKSLIRCAHCGSSEHPFAPARRSSRSFPIQVSFTQLISYTFLFASAVVLVFGAGLLSVDALLVKRCRAWVERQ